MFSFQRMKTHPKKTVFSVFVLFICLAFASCSSDADDSGNLNGKWTFISGAYSYSITVNASEQTIVYENSYEGQIANSPDYGAVNGVLIIKFTKYVEADYSNYPDVTYNETNAYNGKFGALYWNELKAHSVKMADAYEGYSHAMYSTFEEALANFTMNKAGSYVDWSITAPLSK